MLGIPARRCHNASMQEQNQFFQSGITRDLGFRLQQLRKLREVLEEHEADIYRALHEDLRKPIFEAYVGELGMLLEETKFAIKHLKSWMKPRRPSLGLVHWPATAQITQEPYGVALILSPWNYPFQLLFGPLIGAIAAGNCAVLKPSELAPHSAALIQRMVSENFPKEYIDVAEGGVAETQKLLEQPFDYIFFTGSTRVGKIVMEAASRHLTPLTLELGGKSPCLVDASADLGAAARRIVWGKFFNAGQTCVAPDYLLVPKAQAGALLEKMRAALQDFFGEDPQKSPDYVRIINQAHFQRLSQYLSQGKILAGGKTDAQDRYIAPTLLGGVKVDSPVMQEEIFGPILPIIEYETLDEALDLILRYPKPLAFYLFAEDAKAEAHVLARVPFGGGCINDTIAHLGTPELPFGGVGGSGFGSYHGRRSFETFSHPRAILKRSTKVDIPVRYPPYAAAYKLKVVKKLMG